MTPKQMPPRQSGGRFLPWPIRLRNLVATRLLRGLLRRRFGAWGAGSQILLPDSLEGIGNIHIGRDVFIGARAQIAARPIKDGEQVRLDIGEGCRLGRNNHIYATRAVTLGRRVLTASNVYIADNTHGYTDPALAIMDQPLEQLAPVHIGDGSWIGHGACVIGAQVGAGCVIAAGAVVTRDVPDHCLVVGAPARIVKRLNPATNHWRRTDPAGSFEPGEPE